MTASRCPTLVLCWGNPSRGDDALGPMMAEWLETRQSLKFDVLCDFQLQIEYAADLLDRESIIFVDAALNLEKAFSVQTLSAQSDNSISSHALSPQALLQVFQQVYRQPSPHAQLLSIQGYEFALGQSVSAQAENNLQQAKAWLTEQLL